jgi:hypothetical protein
VSSSSTTPGWAAIQSRRSVSNPSTTSWASSSRNVESDGDLPQLVPSSPFSIWRWRLANRSIPTGEPWPHRIDRIATSSIHHWGKRINRRSRQSGSALRKQVACSDRRGSGQGGQGASAVPAQGFLQTQVPEHDRRAQPPLPGYPGGQALQGQGGSGSDGGAHHPLPGADVHALRQRARVQLLRRSTRATLRPYETGAWPATPPARRTSRPDPHGRTALQSRSAAGSGMSSSIPSYSPRLPRLNSWLIAGAGATTRSGHIQPSRGVRPWRQPRKELSHDHDHPLSKALDRQSGPRQDKVQPCKTADIREDDNTSLLEHKTSV